MIRLRVEATTDPARVHPDLEPIISYTKQCENFRFTWDERAIVAAVVRVPEIDGAFLEVEPPLVPDNESVDAARVPTFYIDLVHARRSVRAERNETREG